MEAVKLRPSDEKGNVIQSDYDPHQHRNISKPTNNMETLVHLLKCSLGTGILAMPQAFARAGLVTGTLGTIVVGIILTHCLQVLIRSQYRGCKNRRVPLLSYPESMSAAIEVGPPSLSRFSKVLSVSSDVFIVTYQLGVCCVYIVFIAGNIKKMVDPYHQMALELHMLIILLPLLAFNLIPSLKLLAPFSLLANILTFISLGIIVYLVATGKKSDEELPLDLWGSPTTFPLFFGTVMFALTAVGVVVAVENNMKNPEDFGRPCGVLNIGMSIIVVLYVAIGAIGYVYCVSDCSDSITLDLPEGSLTLSVLIMICIAIFISYGLHCYVPVEVVFKGYILPRLQKNGASDKKIKCAEYILRISLCIFTFVLAISVPRLGLFISLFGAFCLSALGMCFPAMMEMCFLYPNNYGFARIYLIKDILLFIVGIVGLVAGTYTALLAIVQSFM